MRKNAKSSKVAGNVNPAAPKSPQSSDFTPPANPAKAIYRYEYCGEYEQYPPDKLAGYRRLTLRRRVGQRDSLSLRRLFLLPGLERGGNVYGFNVFFPYRLCGFFGCAALILYLIFGCAALCGGCLLPGIRCLFLPFPAGFFADIRKTPPINRVYLILYPASQRNIRAQAPKARRRSNRRRNSGNALFSR